MKKTTYTVQYDYESADALPNLREMPFPGCYVIECMVYGGETYLWAVDLSDNELKILLSKYDVAKVYRKGTHDVREYPSIELKTGYSR